MSIIPMLVLLMVIALLWQRMRGAERREKQWKAEAEKVLEALERLQP